VQGLPHGVPQASESVADISPLEPEQPAKGPIPVPGSHGQVALSPQEVLQASGSEALRQRFSPGGRKIYGQDAVPSVAVRAEGSARSDTSL
jgi:hypothetical protein